jgi:hypothetical protein
MSGIFRKTLLALVAVFALSVLAATAAQATEGPFYKVTGTRLLEGKTNELKAKASKNYVLKVTGKSIECTINELAAGATINGSTGKKAGTSTEVVLFKGCTVTGNGTPCKVVEPIETAKVTNELVWETANREKNILTLFKPVTGTRFTTIKFKTGEKCEVLATEVTGEVAAEALSGGKAIEVGKEPAEAKVGEVSFPKTAIKKVFQETGEETAKELTLKTLKAFGLAAGLEGTSQLTLAAEPLWGIFSK